MSQLRATAVIEHAEAARASHDYAAASAAYENLASWHARPLLSTAALIALAEIEIACGRHPGELLYRARHQADHAAYLPLQAELLVTEGRAGIRDQDATFELLDEVSSAVTPEHLDELRRLAADGTANHSLYCIW
jgi:hypothetical protein